MGKKKCKECGESFTAKSSRVKYCQKHRKLEKSLRKIKDIYECSTCQRILARSETGLGEVVGEVLELQKKTGREIKDSYVRRLRTTKDRPHKPTRYDKHVETAGW